MDLFAEEATERIIINYGETDIIQRQVDRQLLRDARWALLSLLAAAIFLRVGAGSTFLTFAGLVQIIVRPSPPAAPSHAPSSQSAHAERPDGTLRAHHRRNPQPLRAHHRPPGSACDRRMSEPSPVS